MQLVYLCPAVRKPVGGVKVIYNQAALANRLLAPQHGACILHPNTWRHVDPWFDNGVPQMRAWFKPRWVGKPSFSDIRGVFSPAEHCVVIPEVWARKYGTQLSDAGVDYAIYVQNGYFINKGDPADLDRAYGDARVILTISDDSSDCVAMAFPHAKDRIQRVHYSIDAARFNPNASKENLITYMPRKQADHAQKVLFMLRHHLPEHWRIQAISGLKEAGVAALLARSKIFMSFSHFEGCPLPPLEAALSGNHVVGYTGQGAKEYWRPEIFDEVDSGNILNMVHTVAQRCTDWDRSDQLPTMRGAIQDLAATYSAAQEHSDVQRFLSAMGF